MKVSLKDLFTRLPIGVAVKLTLLILCKKWGLNHANIFFSQEGEDIILKFLVGDKRNGFYVDVGCNHPIYLSNTFYFYINNWRGICIDANEVLCEKFRKTRFHDTVVTAAVSNEESEVTFFISDKVPLVSTMVPAQLEEWKKRWEFNREVKMKTQRLESILDFHLKENTVIDFLSVDVEGNDLNVLKSINFKKYRPRYIVVEIHNFILKDGQQNEVVTFLFQNGYELINYSTINGYFKDILS